MLPRTAVRRIVTHSAGAGRSGISRYDGRPDRRLCSRLVPRPVGCPQAQKTGIVPRPTQAVADSRFGLDVPALRKARALTILRLRSFRSYHEVMKDINVSELKAHLSKYLRMAARGIRIVVKDRDEPIAQLGPPPAASAWHERLARAGRLRPGTQDWQALRISPVDRPVDIQESLRAVREDPSEVRGR